MKTKCCRVGPGEIILSRATLRRRPSALVGPRGHARARRHRWIRARSAPRGSVEPSAMFRPRALKSWPAEGRLRQPRRCDHEPGARLGGRRGHDRRVRSPFTLAHGRAARIVRVLTPQGLGRGMRQRGQSVRLRCAEGRDVARGHRVQVWQEARPQLGRRATAVLGLGLGAQGQEEIGRAHV